MSKFLIKQSFFCKTIFILFRLSITRENVIHTVPYRRLFEVATSSEPSAGPSSRDIIDEQQPSTSSYFPTVSPVAVSNSQEVKSDLTSVESPSRASQPDAEGLSELGGRFLQLSSDERRSLLTQRRDEMISKARQRYLQKSSNNNDL